MNSFSTSITPGERVSFEGGVSESLVVTIVEGVAGVVVSPTEEIGSNRGGVFMKTSALATREVGLVIIEFRSTSNVGDLELITSCKLELTGDEDVAGVKTSSLVDSS